MRGVWALWFLPLWATVDVAMRPATAFATARHHKAVWLVPGPLVISSWFLADLWFTTVVLALLMTAAYLAKVRDMVRLAQGLHSHSR